MNRKGMKSLCVGLMFLIAFAVWTALVMLVDVRPEGQNGTKIGLATLNLWFHSLTGVHMQVYILTDWLGLVPVFICMIFGALGFIQLVRRRSFFRVDIDIILLGIYYIIVILCYLVFEMIPINYRPVLIDGRLEASYPSSTTLLVLCVMPTLLEQTHRRLISIVPRRIIRISALLFTIFMVAGRTVSGVHWLSDIAGAVFLSIGLFFIYKASTEAFGK